MTLLRKTDMLTQQPHIESEQEAMYSRDEVYRIIQGYRLLDRSGLFSSLLKRISKCDKCIRLENGDLDKPLNFLVRPLPLHRLTTPKEIRKYTIRIKRDDTFLRNIFKDFRSTEEVKEKIGSARFCIGILPWLDRCMLIRTSEETKLMIVGIDYKNFPVFFRQGKDQNFPFDSYRKKNNIWGSTWRKFWTNLLGSSYDEETVNNVIAAVGLYVTNSMLCFGGGKSPRAHNFDYISCCRDHIKDQIKIVSPKIIVSFGNFGCKNVASILLDQNEDNPLLKMLVSSSNPLKEMKLLSSTSRCKDGIKVRYDSSSICFWPLYQPGWSHIHKYDGEYDVLRSLLGLRSRVV